MARERSRYDADGAVPRPRPPSPVQPFHHLDRPSMSLTQPAAPSLAQPANGDPGSAQDRDSELERDSIGRTALQGAIENGSFETFLRVVEKHDVSAPIERQDSRSGTLTRVAESAFDLACMRGNFRVAQWLLPGATASMTPERWKTVLFRATIDNHFGVVELAEPFVDVKAPLNENNETALLLAMSFCREKIVDFLLPLSDARVKCVDGTTALAWAVKNEMEKRARDCVDSVPEPEREALVADAIASLFAIGVGDGEEIALEMLRWISPAIASGVIERGRALHMEQLDYPTTQSGGADLGALWPALRALAESHELAQVVSEASEATQSAQLPILASARGAKPLTRL